MGFDIYAKVVDWEWSGVGVEERPTDQCPMTNVQLMQNVPNPFSKETRMAYSVRPVAETGNAISHKPLGIRLKVYDVRGRLVKTLVDGSKEPGAYASTWDGRDEGGEPVPSGVYFYRLNSADQTVTKKMVLLR